MNETTIRRIAISAVKLAGEIMQADPQRSFPTVEKWVAAAMPALVAEEARREADAAQSRGILGV